MNISKTEFIALVVLMLVGFHFYNQYRLESDDYAEVDIAPILMYDKRPPVIVAFGDSLTKGDGASPRKNYPAQLSDMLGIDIINEGHSGELSRDAARRITQVLKRHHPDIVLIETGFEDILAGRDRSQLKENLEKIVKDVKNSNAIPIIIGVPDLDLVGLMITSDIGLYEEVAQKTGALYIPDLFGPVLGNESLKSDESHPNAKGYKTVARSIDKFLKGLMQ
ncbi:GDSL-type esterase/lipase family protein [Hydrogenimonas sp.]